MASGWKKAYMAVVASMAKQPPDRLARRREPAAQWRHERQTRWQSHGSQPPNDGVLSEKTGASRRCVACPACLVAGREDAASKTYTAPSTGQKRGGDRYGHHTVSVSFIAHETGTNVSISPSTCCPAAQPPTKSGSYPVQ